MSTSRMVIWGGNARPLALDTLDSHASVVAYFLGRRLAEFFEITHLVDMDKPEELFDHTDADIMLSTFQYGFTSRLLQKGRAELFDELRRRFSGPLCSVVDCNGVLPYGEDVLFTVMPPSRLRTWRARRLASGRDLRVRLMGWSAEPEQCYPEPVPDEAFNLFIDHPHYAEDAPDCTQQCFLAARLLQQEFPQRRINVFHQGMEGVAHLDLDGAPPARQYVRAAKVAWPEIIATYRRMHAFCVTHQESAGLAAIEAAMCGATLCVPRGRWGRTFIPPKLVRQVPQRVTHRYTPDPETGARRIAACLRPFLAGPDHRTDQHRVLRETNSWEVAARRLATALGC